MPRTILMGDPAYFSVRGGANPHTRNLLGMRKTVDPRRARVQWHAMAQALLAHGAEVLVVPADQTLPGLVYPANAGVLYPPQGVPAADKTFYLSNLLPTRAGERAIYQRFIGSLGFATAGLVSRFEGEADFFPAGRFMLFTFGAIERQRFVPSLGLPPWRRVYGFRSAASARNELSAIAAGREVLALELCLEAHYHGDTVLCSFGPEREYLMAYMKGLTSASQTVLREAFGANLIGLEPADAALYAANSFQLDDEAGRLRLFMPAGVSTGLQHQIRVRGIEPHLMDVSEFLAKGGGSVKCMILDLGPAEEQPSGAAPAAFRSGRGYRRLFPAGAHS